MIMKNNEDHYTGENEKWFQFNKRIVIYREDGIPYLIRRTLFSFGSWFSIKYHQILVSDEACMHDHPWSFLTIILKGGYYEWTPQKQKDSGEYINSQFSITGENENRYWHKPGSIMYRPANWEHRLELKESEQLWHVDRNDGNIFLTEIPPHTIIAHTLVFTGKVVRDWGFITKNGWIFWKDYNRDRHC
jgi:hypothetical protein